MTHSQKLSLVLALALGAGCGGYGSSESTVHVETSGDDGPQVAEVAYPTRDDIRAVGPSYADTTAYDTDGYADTGGEAHVESEAPVEESAPSYADDMPAPPPMAPTSTGASRASRSAPAPGAFGGGAMARRPVEPTPMAEAPAVMDEAASVAVTTTTTTTVTVTAEPSPVVPVQAQAVARLLTAASVGDVDRRQNYLEYLSRHSFEGRRLGLDTSRRLRFRVTDGQGNPVLGARIESPELGVVGRTHADGVWDFYPGVVAQGSGGPARFRIAAQGMAGEVVARVPYQGDSQDIVVRLDGVAHRPVRALELGFLIDVTGSMEDELRYVNQEVGDIVARVQASAPEVAIRVGATFYRDRTDSVPLSQIPFTSDVAGFAAAMHRVTASGGGDYPEDMNSGLRAALAQLGDGAQGGDVDRVLVLIADAPPQRYRSNFTYLDAMRLASARGIRLVPVAASGADREVEYLFRAMGAVTSTPYVYLTDDSGIGGHHQEADTDRVAVEYLSDLLTRMLVSDLAGRGMHEPGGFGPRG